MKTAIVQIEKLVFGGQALAHLEDGSVIFVWNAIPGEKVEIEIIGKKKGVKQGIARKILELSEHRIEPKEAHFLSSSPWSIMTSDEERKQKQFIAMEAYEKIGGLVFDTPISIHEGEKIWGYRNKIEWSFTENENRELELAFFARGQKHRIIAKESVLAEDIINKVSKRILDWIRSTELTNYNMKSLIVRSNGKGEAIASLYIKDKLEFDHFPELDSELLGFEIYYSTHKSPASVPTEKLYSFGADYLYADLGGVKMKFGAQSFFQVNLDIFEKALEKISFFVPNDKKVLDFYTGVGAIGLPLAGRSEEMILVDSNEEGIEFAKENIKENNIKNAEAHCAPAEKILDPIERDTVLIVDPPRAGLHKDVTKRILETVPEKIIYMSCNVSTHARDIALLKEKYEIIFLELFNFFPRTPHIESIAVLERK